VAPIEDTPRGARPQVARRRRAAAALAALVAFITGAALGALPTRAATECDEMAPAWLACDGFEAGSSGWQPWFEQSPWVECNGCPDGLNNPSRIRLAGEPGAAHSGDWALHMPAGEAAGWQGASLTYRDCDGQKRPGCRLNGHDTLYFRTWVKLAPDHEYVHHFLEIAGTRPNAYWESDGNAGCRPDGERWAGTTLDFNARRELHFYTYFPEMRCDAGNYCSGDYARQICAGCAAKNMPCRDRQECCWGNHFAPDPPVVLPRDRWVCLEIGMHLNTPGQNDGWMAFWVDGELGHRQDGMHWRDTAELQLNKAWLQHYIAGSDNAGRSNAVWFDDVVVSTERIGCGSSVPGPTASATVDPGAPTQVPTVQEPTPPEPTAQEPGTPEPTAASMIHLPSASQP
jgi:hypothetical protein